MRIENPLAGRRVLLVEDEFFIMAEMESSFEEAGAEVIGPAANLDDALSLATQSVHIDGAVLDVNLRGEFSFPVADALQARGVPFVFATGYDEKIIPPRFAGITRCEKPVSASQLAKMLWH